VNLYYNMKKNISIIALGAAMTFFSCSNGQDVFPNTVNVSRTDNLVRMKGSKLFVKVPADYKPLTSLVRYQKSDRIYFQVIEVPNTNFVEYKSKISRQSIESQGAKVDAHETVQYNGFEGIYFEGPSKIPGETKLALVFGDETFVTMILGVCPTSDKSSKDELKSIFGNSFYDKSYQLNPLELANFQVDETITGFKYATTMGNIFFYTRSGKADMKGLLDSSSYQIMPLEAGSFEKVKELLETINSRLILQGIQTSNVRKTEIVINGNKAIEVTMDVKDKDNKKGKCYQAGIYKEGSNSAVLFIGGDNENGLYFDKLKATAQSIKL
jgi:hypothetical protein